MESRDARPPSGGWGRRPRRRQGPRPRSPRRYLLAVPVRLGSTLSVVRSLPRLYSLPGHTPYPVKAGGTWLPDKNLARFTWDASTDTKLSYYQVRWCPGDTCDKKEGHVAGTVR